jgi:hypothetical protein
LGVFAKRTKNRQSRSLASREKIHDSARLSRGLDADVQDVRGFQELESASEIDELQGGVASLLSRLSSQRISGTFLVLQGTGEDRGVVEDDSVGDEAAAFRPEFPLALELETHLAEAGVGEGPA